MENEFISALENKRFVITGELEPGRSVNLDVILEEAKKIKPFVSAANVTDNPGSFVSMSGLAVAISILYKVGLDPIFQLTCRDQNRIGLASSLLGAAATGIKNILLLTGDHTTLGDVPQAKPVFDLDSAQLVQLANEIRYSHSIYGNPLEDHELDKPLFNIGIAANPNSTDPDIELLKIERKVEQGVDFIQTQVVYDLENTEYFFKELRKFGVPVLAGIFPMKNYATARDFDKFVAGVNVPKDLLENFKKIKETYTNKKEKHAAYDKLNVEFLKPLILELKRKHYINGIHVTAVHYTRIFPLLIKELSLD